MASSLLSFEQAGEPNQLLFSVHFLQCRKNLELLHKKCLTPAQLNVIVKIYRFMAKNLVSLLLWFIFTPILLISAIFITAKQNANQSSLENYASVASNEFEINNNIEGQVLSAEISDLRPYTLSKFLDKTPLAPYSEYIVEVSDKYGIDYRLIPAIAMKESGGGVTIDQSTHNAWGWENGITNFSSWESAIETVGKTLKKNYIAKGLVTPEQIMVVYAPPQVETGGKWAQDINLFFSQMESL
ncbi:hypothetical protein A3G14_01650 [Candidatus Curtissbacteria bacterium RIFCSPLOWO2_12_FULL_38_9]|uniref:Mannosyl-glycoprotein endo-beta-N-acetylglucosamidase-like domain-containing protein n=1 Tax=Candidatus Curtissbacteria bacterium RIFCSPLOWO2_12_FULL_38_9 TaxID=1797735 RepID=A0A1F5IAN0_9BACT|nr:MAG: hypothetical protein A3G14_01650 [Candidatus Curtissbacteria bacterium RIFCSPLOWO2_12_FULL_38_9]